MRNSAAAAACGCRTEAIRDVERSEVLLCPRRVGNGDRAIWLDEASRFTRVRDLKFSREEIGNLRQGVQDAPVSPPADKRHWQQARDRPRSLRDRALGLKRVIQGCKGAARRGSETRPTDDV